MKVLVVEDDIFIGLFFKVKIRRHFNNDTEIKTCSDLKEVMDVLFEFKPDIILLDLGLPDSPPDETIKYIKMMEKYGAVIVISNDTDPNTAKKCYAAGASDFLSKLELNLENLYQRMEDALLRRQYREENWVRKPIPDDAVSPT
jgi:two-component system KDP operon response regulator KdpE